MSKTLESKIRADHRVDSLHDEYDGFCGASGKGNGDEIAGDLASSILFTLGFEWV